jgi:amino acid adenylation domain-containing protein
MKPAVKSIGDIAIIGMAGRFPGARDIQAFWRNLKDGVESISFFTEAELAAAGVSAELLANPAYVRARPLLEDADKFDAEFFGISRREAEVMDPQHRVFLETAWEALEHAGYDSETYDGAIGLFAGLFFNTYLLANLCTNRERTEGLLDRSHPGAMYSYLGNDKDYLTTRVAYKLNLRGPAITLLTSCSTSLIAVAQACQSLLCHQCDMALAGGVAILSPPLRGYLSLEGGMVSPDGHCRPFDARGQGTLFGNGCGLVLLKRLPDALADGDHIHAVIKGSAVNNDGSAKVSFTAPSVDGQAEVIALAQALAGLTADAISYIEAHGTGTPLGDPIEVEALTQAFRQTTDRTGFCGIGSLKSNMGHLDVAAGVAGLIKTALALQHRLIPPTLHFTTPNPTIDFENSPFYVVSKPTEWKTDGEPRRAGVSSFGVGGTNAHVVVEEAPAEALEPSGPSRPVQLLTISAKVASALDQACARLADYLEANPQCNLADVAYTLEVGRRALPQRRVLACRDAAEAVALLRQPDLKRVFTDTAKRRDPPVVFMFPGQGAQQINMGRELYASEPVFRDAVDRCAALLQPRLGLDLRAALADADLLVQTRITQPALFVIEYALAQLWMSWGVRPAAMIGHSVGEYVAGCLAGVFTLEDALMLVAERARLVQAQPGGAMLAARLPENELRPLLDDALSIAAINSPGLCIASGPFAAIEALERQLKAAGKASVRLSTSHAFHSAMMEPVVAPFTDLLKSVRLSAPQIPYVSNVTAQWITAADATNPDYWAGHVRQAVRFADGVAQLLADPASVLLEVGPGQTLSALARQHPARQREQAVVSSLGQGSELETMLTARGRLWLAGLSLEAASFYAGERRRRIPLPTYPFQRQRYWVEPDWASAGGSGAARQAEETTVAALPAATSPVAAAAPAPTGRAAIVATLRELLREASGNDYSTVDEQTTFVEMGFESLSLTQVTLAIAKRFGVRVAFRQMLGDLGTLAALASHLEQATPAPVPVAAAPAVPVVAADTAPLTEAQHEVWLAAAMDPEGSCAFNQSSTIHLRGQVQVPVLEWALSALVVRHEGLRARFSATGETQQIGPAWQVPLPLVDLTSLAPSERPPRLDAMLREEAAQPMDLARGPIVRARLVRLAADEQVLLFTVHHIVCDGRSQALLLHDLGELYSAKAQGCPPALPPSESLCAYARLEAAAQAGPDRVAAEAYWLRQFASEPPALAVPTDRPRPARKSFPGELTSMTLSPELLAGLRRASARQGCTLFTTLLAVYYLFLHRLTGQEDLVVGVPTASPGTGGKEQLVGHTVNFLPLRATVTGKLTWADHVTAVKQMFLDAYDHGQFTYGSLIQKLKLGRDRGRIPLVAVAFNLAHGRQPVRFAGLEAERAPNPHSFTNFDLNFDFNEDGDTLDMDCIYNADLFQAETIQRWLRHFQTVLAAVADNPAQSVGELPLLTPAERRHIVEDFNATTRPYPRDKSITDLFAAQAAQRPDAVAVVGPDRELTYRQLDTEANQLAHHLRALGVKPGVPVGFCVERSAQMIVGLLGVLKAGGAYVALEPAWPAERLTALLDQTQTPVLVTTQSLRDRFSARDGNCRMVCLDAVEWADQPTTSPAGGAGPEDLAYVSFTSGSTGKPKGVCVPHRAVLRLVCNTDYAQLGPEDVFLHLAPLAFDASTLEIWGALLNGARLVIYPPGPVAPAELGRALRQHRVSVLWLTAGLFNQVVEHDAASLTGVSQILTGGDVLSVPHVAKALAQVRGRLINGYGPTENTTFTTCHPITAAPLDRSIPIGRPIANTQVYIVDERMQPVPIGVAGELVTGGDGLALGYLNQPELTAEKFVPNLFSDQPGARLYKTGDLARYLPDGTIEFLGRRDLQVKLRGFRIELGEIEAVLGQHPAVAECTVTLRTDRGDKRLVGYVVAKAGAELVVADLRRFLVEKLPDYMVPAAFVSLPVLPLNANGKVDRQALPAPEPATTTRVIEPPRTSSEELVAKTWAEVLQLPAVGRDDNFFELGGHSLLAIQVSTRLGAALDMEFPVRSLFDAPTVAALAAHVDTLCWARQGRGKRPTTKAVRGEL